MVCDVPLVPGAPAVPTEEPVVAALPVPSVPVRESRLGPVCPGSTMMLGVPTPAVVLPALGPQPGRDPESAPC
jgi:hypothetical protein